MRVYTQLVKAVVLLVLFGTVAASAHATSIPVRGKSSYGTSGLVTGTTTAADGIQESLSCASSASDCPGNFDLLMVFIPDLAPGTVVTLNGVGSLNALLCEGTSFIGGDCSGGVSVGQQACLDSLNPNTISGGFQITAASCAISNSIGHNFVTLVFNDPNSVFATSVSTKLPTATPEPVTLVLLGVGVGVLGFGRKFRRAA